MFIMPAPDRLVRDPETRRPVGEEGLTIDPTNLYWARVIADGDVVEAPEPVAERRLGGQHQRHERAPAHPYLRQRARLAKACTRTGTRLGVAVGIGFGGSVWHGKPRKTGDAGAACTQAAPPSNRLRFVRAAAAPPQPLWQPADG